MGAIYQRVRLVRVVERRKKSDSLVLVVEDDHDARVSIRQLLEDEGYTVQSAAEGASAISWLHVTPILPKVMILDLWMPIMDGWEVVERVRADQQLRDLPVIVVTADKRSQPPDSSHLIRKPFKAVALLQLVAQLGEGLPPPSPVQTLLPRRRTPKPSPP